MRLRARHAGDRERVADRRALDCLDRADRHRQAPVHPLLPGDVRAEPRHEPERLHLEDAAERLVRLAQIVDLADHRARRIRVEAAHRRAVDLVEVRERQHPLCHRRAHRGDLHDVRAHLDAERAQERLAQRAARDARRRLARRRALEDVAHVRLLVLLRADEVGVARARQVHLGELLLDRPRVHPLLPVGVVAVCDLQRDRATERAPVADARRDLRRVALDLHPPAAAVAELPARHVLVEVLRAQREAGRQALYDARQPRAVRLPGGDQSKRHTASLFAARSAPERPAPRRGVGRCCGGVRARGESVLAGEDEHSLDLRVAQTRQALQAALAQQLEPRLRFAAERSVRARQFRLARDDADDVQLVDDRVGARRQVFEFLRLPRLRGRSPGTATGSADRPPDRAGSLRRRA